MDGIIEESEIKIEYNETYETDPLLEEYHENQIFVTEGAGSEPTDSYIQKHMPHPYKTHKMDHRNDSNTKENSRSWFQSKDRNGKLLCKFCELKYSTIQTLRHHVKNKHPEDAEKLCKIIINNKRNHKHICHICKRRFKDLNDLKSHVKYHSIKLVETSCIQCNAAFTNTEELLEHTYIKHKKENRVAYMCKICGYRTSKKSHYNQHINTHNENKALTCQTCDYKTNYLPNLKIHERIHSNYKPYLCDFENCNYRSSTKSALNSHQLKHYPNENMLFCEKCSYSTVYKQSLRKHLDSHKRNCVRKNDGVLK